VDTSLRGTEFVGHFCLSGTSGRLKQSIMCQIKQLLESRLSRRGFPSLLIVSRTVYEARTLCMCRTIFA